MTIAAAGQELYIAEAWIYGVLHADAELEALLPGTNDEVIWAGIAPTGTPEPYIIASYQGGQDVNGLGSGLARIYASALYQVVAMGPGADLHRLAPIAARIDACLHGKSGEVLADDLSVLGTVLSCVRERPFSLPEEVAGKQYRRLGGIYRLSIQ